MLRIRISLPARQRKEYIYYDLIHDALISAWVATGAKSEDVIGFHALPWNFAALGYHKKQQAFVHTLIVSTSNLKLAQYLTDFSTAAINYTRVNTGEQISFADAKIKIESSPIYTGQKSLGVFLLSPLAIRQRGKSRQWHTNLNMPDLSEAINYRLSQIAKREVKLQVYPDSLYLRANPKHSILVKTKRMKNHKKAFVVGMQAPLLLMGSEDDLALAWYAGIGEKNNNGFGCIGSIEEGIGR